jgi:Undecaprenyl-phosphate glucose phosphotransferase
MNAHTNIAGPEIEVALAAPQPRAKTISQIVLGDLICFLEVGLTALAGIAILFIYLGAEATLASIYGVAILGVALAQTISFRASKLYDLNILIAPTRNINKILLAWIYVFAAFAILAFLSKTGSSFSRVWMGSWFVVGLLTFLGFRGGVYFLTRKWLRQGLLETRIAIVGGGERAERLIQLIAASNNPSIRICGVFDDRGKRVANQVSGYPKLGSVNSLIEFTRTAQVDMLIINLPPVAEDRILEITKKLSMLPVDIRLATHFQKLKFLPGAVSQLESVPLLRIVNKPITDWGIVCKAVEDRVLAAIILVLTLPIFALSALAIKATSPGPVFFRQKRYGFDNKLVEIYKFRSLRNDMVDRNATKLVTADDPRVTRVGKILRKSSLDELPQLINVLKGEMSLVGPRPHATQARAGERLYQEVVDNYYCRHRMKPGITGWAQINGWRGQTDTEEKIVERVNHDIQYIDNWSILLDLYIIAKTPWVLLKGENAY